MRMRSWGPPGTQLLTKHILGKGTLLLIIIHPIMGQLRNCTDVSLHLKSELPSSLNNASAALAEGRTLCAHHMCRQAQHPATQGPCMPAESPVTAKSLPVNSLHPSLRGPGECV